MPEGLLAQLDLVDAVTEKIASTDLSGLAGSLAAEVSQRVRRATDRLAAQRLVLIGQIEAEGSWRVETMHSFSSWLACSEGLSTALAKRTVAAARALRDHLPATAAAACAGEITAEHVSLMVKATVTETLCEVLATPVTSDTPAGPVCTGEQMLLGHAGAFKVDEFAKLIKSFTVVSDPQAQEKAFKDAVEWEFLQISPTMGGMQISGFVTTEHGQAFNAALRAVAGVPAADDLRPADLRKVDSLVDLAHLVLDGGIAGKGANVRPHLSVHITWEEFKNLHAHAHAHATDGGGDGDTDGSSSQTWSPEDVEARLLAGFATWEDGTGPIPDAVLRRIACDGEITRIIFGPDSQILNISRTKRTFTKEHRRAIVARDRHCVWEGCDAPPHVCEIHHAIRHWADGGETTPSNGALLCRHHHHRVDGENIAMIYDDGWHFAAPGSYQPGSDQAGRRPGAQAT
ncbi:HNH endonuclease [Sanguibacter gelidistatuariae]|uniref:HNH endonuclease n=1 Tax=Sanguibacter gelidistatuariae TaxID=1814289 RepID=UPI000B8977B3|nr:HNH endonuclease signature motif containing protein [Sanguibacter gelidistatuariae]